MRRFIAMLLVVSGCYSAAPPATTPAAAVDPGAALSARFARALTSVAAQRGVHAEAAGNVVRLAGHEVVVDAIAEGQSERDGLFLLGYRIVIALDGHAAPALTTGNVGIGRSREAAEQEAVTSWGNMVGYALVNGLSPPAAQAAPPGTTLAPYSINPGEPGVRGQMKGTWDEGAQLRLIDGLTQKLDALLPGGVSGFHMLTVFVVVEDGRVTKGECRVDGVVSRPLLEIVGALEWPAGEYMFKQFLLLRSTRP